MTKGYYLRDSDIGLDEDDMHEFKSHRSIQNEDIPNWCLTQEGSKIKRSRQPVSKTICSFLNTGKGGVVYLGILNEGTVAGIKLTQYQRDHIVANVDDLLTRFVPRVDPGRLKIAFKPVLDEEVTCAKLAELLRKDSVCDQKSRFERAHTLRSSAYCWCDKEAKAKFAMGMIILSYVIEITVLPWDGETDRPNTDTPLNPLYQSEEGQCYIRRQASNVMVTLQEVYDMTRNQVINYWDPQIRKMESEVKKLRVEFREMLKNHQKDPVNAVVNTP